MTKRQQIAQLILEEADPRKCVALFASEFPDAERSEVLSVADECEPFLRQQGLGDLSAFRRELENAKRCRA